MARAFGREGEGRGALVRGVTAPSALVTALGDGGLTSVRGICATFARTPRRARSPAATGRIRSTQRHASRGACTGAQARPALLSCAVRARACMRMDNAGEEHTKSFSWFMSTYLWATGGKAKCTLTSPFKCARGFPSSALPLPCVARSLSPSRARADVARACAVLRRAVQSAPLAARLRPHARARDARDTLRFVLLLRPLARPPGAEAQAPRSVPFDPSACVD